ncbi:MAG TPA: hypothetical protein VHF47_08930 [Acidimicrobiales bacterium]|nr:hypothetical protein [Acidimicrobiales bacterium]
MSLVRALVGAVVLLLVAAVVALADVRAPGPSTAAEPGPLGTDLAALAPPDLTTTTSSTTTTTTTALPTTTTTAPPPPPTTRSAPVAAAAAPARLQPPAVPTSLEPYRGLGTWVDVYDWTNSYTGGKPAVGPADVDRMADLGVQTLYLQASKWDSPTDVTDGDLLVPILERAEQRGIRLVVWYLPTLTDPARDLQRLVAIAALPHVDGVAVDIESREVADVAERNRRLVQLSAALRQALPGRTIGAIVLPPVVLEVVNPSYWPGFPYQQLAPHYDVWLTMGYWTNRKADSGYRDAYRYTRENVDRLRANLNAVVPVHPIGGLGAGTSAADVEAYRRAAVDTGSLGGSLYDWRTTRGEAWPGMQGFRA